MPDLRSRQPPRAIPDISSSIRQWELLEQLLDEGHPRDTMYLYRMEGGRALTPAFYAGEVFPGLLSWLRDEYGTGTFRIMIKRGGTLKLSGSVSVLAPRDRHAY